jgi:hypothetical protein
MLLPVAVKENLMVNAKQVTKIRRSRAYDSVRIQQRHRFEELIFHALIICSFIHSFMVWLTTLSVSQTI